jgi:hypothetical protein
MTRWTSASVVLLVAAWLVRCVDTTPLALTDPQRDAGNGDAFGDGSIDTPCHRCIVEPGAACFPVYESCLATPACPELTDCLFEQHCFEIPKFDDRVTCAIPCFERAGVQVGSHPAVNAALAINVCTIDNCVDECPFQP